MTETAELRSRRAGLIQQIRHYEWSFDKQASQETAATLRELRRELCDLETHIADVVTEEGVKLAIVNSTIALGRLNAASVGGDSDAVA